MSSQSRDDLAFGESETIQEEQEAARDAVESVRNIMEKLNPLVEASKAAALEFEGSIREKKKISKDLNDPLDSKMISINLLLSRAETCQEKLEQQQQIIRSRPAAGPALSPAKGVDVLNQQNQIIDLYYQQMDIDTIAE
ncbi:MAG: hypothetical protein HUN05_20860 [Desulfobacter sp.]|nr:MAG: hypothetical protein HUN05_20860 [Desulfobacter sp.]